jgi:predicted Zn-dependent protease
LDLKVGKTRVILDITKLFNLFWIFPSYQTVILITITCLLFILKINYCTTLFSDIKQTLQNLLHALNKQQNFSIIGEHGTIYFQVVEKQSRVIFHPSKKQNLIYSAFLIQDWFHFQVLFLVSIFLLFLLFLFLAKSSSPWDLFTQRSNSIFKV